MNSLEVISNEPIEVPAPSGGESEKVPETINSIPEVSHKTPSDATKGTCLNFFHISFILYSNIYF